MSEKQSILDKISSLERELKELGNEKKEAMADGGWHDNAAWDSVLMREKLLLSRINELKQQLKRTE